MEANKEIINYIDKILDKLCSCAAKRSEDWRFYSSSYATIKINGVTILVCGSTGLAINGTYVTYLLTDKQKQLLETILTYLTYGFKNLQMENELKLIKDLKTVAQEVKGNE